jgi:hypothetical protein
MYGSFVGALPFFSDAVGNTVVQVKAGAGQLLTLRLVNTTAQPAYLQVFDQLAADVNLGTTVPKWTVRLGANESVTVPLTMPLTVGSLSDPNAGISMAGTTQPQGTSAAAISVSALYQ